MAAAPVPLIFSEALNVSFVCKYLYWVDPPTVPMFRRIPTMKVNGRIFFGVFGFLMRKIKKTKQIVKSSSE